MNIRKLKDFVGFIPGINQTRAENQFMNQNINYYDQAAFEMDYYFIDDANSKGEPLVSESRLALCADDIVISNTKQVASIVGTSNAGKLLSMNFTKVEFLKESLDKRYFLYLFNSSKTVRRQKERQTQGSSLIQKIPLRSLGEIEIPHIPLPQQELIGNAYVEMLQIQNKLKRYSELTESLTYSAIETILKEVTFHEK